MRPATAYLFSGFVHVLAFGVVSILSADPFVQYRVASGEPILIQFSPATAAEPPQPITLEVTTEIEPAPQPPEEEVKPAEHAIEPRPMLVERRPTAEVADDPARAEPTPQTKPADEMPTRSVVKTAAPETPKTPPRKVERKPATELAVATSAVAMQAQAAVQAGAKVDEMPLQLPANPEPPYPNDAWQAGREGRVMLRVMIGATGLVERAGVEKSSGWASFDDSALTTIRRWRFEPARRAGASVSFEVLIPVRFQLRRG